MNQKCFARLRPFGFVLSIALVVGCAGKIQATNIPPATITQPVTPIASLTSTVEPSLTINPAATLVDTKPVWEIKENWSPANQIRTMLIDQNGDLWTGGPAGVVHWNLKTNTPTVYAVRDNPENTYALGLSQTPDGSIWVGTYGNGLARFDGTRWQTFTKNDGLPGDFIIGQIVTSQGRLWLVILKERQSRDGAQFGWVNNMTWIREDGGAFDHILALPDESIVGIYNPAPVGGIYFSSYVMIFDGQKWNGLDVYPDGWVNAITVAPDGVMWLATNNTVYRYMNPNWSQFKPPWAKKDYYPPVSSMAVSKNGQVWIGFSRRAAFDIDRCGQKEEYKEEYYYREQGVYRYDGKIWMHFTSENGLINNKICAITIDVNDNIWFGSFDKGVSRFDGKTWTSYVVP